MADTKNLGLNLQPQTDFYNVEKFNENFQKIDDFAGRKDNPHGVTANQTGAIARVNYLLEQDISVLDRLTSPEYAGNWGWLAPKSNPFGYPEGTLCVITNDIINYDIYNGVHQSVKPVYPTPNCDEIYVRAYYYGNEHSGGSVWTEWKKIAMADEFLSLAGGKVRGQLGVGNGKGVLNGNDYGAILQAFVDDSNYRSIRVDNPSQGAKADQWLKLIDCVSGAITQYRVFGEHNKPSGSYIGNGTYPRTIEVGGTGKALVIFSDTVLAIATPYICFASVRNSTSGGSSENTNYGAKYENGVLTLSDSLTDVNVNGYTYYYQVL